MSSTLTFNLAKGLYHVRNALHYFEHIHASKLCTGKSRHLIGIQANKLRSIITDIKHSVTPESADILQKEMDTDTMVFESIYEKLLLLDEKQRWEIESLIDGRLRRLKQ